METTHRSEKDALIEEAAEAFGGLNSPKFGAAAEWERAEVREGVERVMAVFEKVRTPADLHDDEREALMDALREGERKSRAAGSSAATLLSAQLGAILAAGFRRSVVPEPSAEEPECFAEKPDWPEHWTTNDKLRDLHARWHEQKGNLIGREECGYERCEFWDAAEFTLRLADVHIAGREPQGEPSDALPLWERPEAIEAARLAYQGAYEADYDAEDCIAFALRAAAITEQGEDR